MTGFQKKKINKLFALWFAIMVVIFGVPAAFGNAPSWLTGAQNKTVYSSEHVRAELVAYAPSGVMAGEEVWFGLKIEHQPGWHTYWKNPGDVGVPTQLTWSLPDGMTISDIQWPTPQVLYITDDIIDYGYEGTVFLPVRATIAPDFLQGSNADTNIGIGLQANWLVCRQECIPESADLVLTVSTQPSSTSMQDVGLLESFSRKSPVTLSGVQAQVHITPAAKETSNPGQDVEETLIWTITGLPEHWQGQDLYLLPEQQDIIVNFGADSAGWENAVWQARYQLNPNRSMEPQLLNAVILPNHTHEAQINPVNPIDQTGARITAVVTGTWPEQKAYEIPPSLWQEDRYENQQSGVSASQGVHSAIRSPTSLLWMMGFAILGGLLLNLMPCVFPVLSITALSFACAGQHDQRAQRTGGLAYGLGTVVTMLVLAAILLILRAGGAALGWGFQLQSPVFVALMAALFLLIALNLLGVYEIKIFLPQSVSNLRSQNPALDSFCSGMVAVLVATPCTAPFMGAALGAALMIPAWQTLLIFLALGTGLALPLVLIAFIPGLMRWLPRPGAWMLTFRQLMAFPMLAAALWLVWVVSVQTGTDGAIGLLVILLTLAFLIWVLGWMQKTSVTSKTSKFCAFLFAALCVSGALYGFASDLQNKRVDAHEQINTKISGEQAWGVWSAGSVERYLDEKRIVFVDFTAAWCVTCQMNKKATLSNDNVLKAFSDKEIVLLRADWTNYDPLITAELERLGRSGVPVYAVYQAGHPPKLLPEILTPQIIHDTLNELNLK